MTPNGLDTLLLSLCSFALATDAGVAAIKLQFAVTEQTLMTGSHCSGSARPSPLGYCGQCPHWGLAHPSCLSVSAGMAAHPEKVASRC